MASMNVKKGDTVLVIVGTKSSVKADAEKGKKGKVLKVDSEKGKVIVEGANMIKRHTRPKNAREKGGIIDKPRAIDASNVMVVCPSCNKPTRVAHALSPDGKKHIRTCKKCGAVLDVKAEKTVKKVTKKRAPKQPTETPVESKEE